MEACHIQRISRNENLRAAFLQKSPKEYSSQVTHDFAHRGTARRVSGSPGARSSVSSPSAAVHQETLDILEGLRTKQHSPLLLIPQITYDKIRSKRHAHIFAESISKADNRPEAYSPKARISVPPPLYPSYRNISSGTIASSKGSPTSIRYLLTALNPPNRYSQQVRTLGTPHAPRTPLLENQSPSLIKPDFPSSFSIKTSFDGRELATDFINYMSRSSVHSQWTCNPPDHIDRNPTPVLERASSWAMSRLRSGTIYAAQVLRLHPQSNLSVDADMCYQQYCSMPSCKHRRRR